MMQTDTEVQTKPSRVLAAVTTRRIEVDFDPTNISHLKAFEDLNTHGRQSTHMRFKLEFPFLDVRSMMLAKIAEAYLNSKRGTDGNLGVNRVRRLKSVQ